MLCYQLSSVVWWIACMQLDPRLIGWNLAKGDKNLQHTFLRRGSKTIDPCHKVLWHVKEPFKLWKRYFVRQKFIISFDSSSCFVTRWLVVGLLENSGRWIRRFPLSISFRHGSPCSYHLGDEQ
jgi:hypothetical protein